MGWNPWAHVRETYPEITVVTHQELPGRIWGLRAGNLIWLCKRLDQARRRCTLTHEIIHLERGAVPADLIGHAREERTVAEEAARRLIPLEDLANALRWTRDCHQLAEQLWVDVPTLRTRLDTLDPIEVAQLEHDLDGQWIP